ncbi:hypothetical protein EJB05_16477, partial [Eragrostis curvula]
MDRVVRLFFGGTVNDHGELIDMSQQVVTFVKAPMFSDIEAEAKSVVSDGGSLKFRGRFDAGGGGRAHYVLLDLSTEDCWFLYKECLRDAQVRIAEVIVDVVGNCEEGVAVVPEGVTLDEEPIDGLTQVSPYVSDERVRGSPVMVDNVSARVPGAMNESLELAVVNNDFEDNTFEDEDREQEEEANVERIVGSSSDSESEPEEEDGGDDAEVEAEENVEQGRRESSDHGNDNGRDEAGLEAGGLDGGFDGGRVEFERMLPRERLRTERMRVEGGSVNMEINWSAIYSKDELRALNMMNVNLPKAPEMAPHPRYQLLDTVYDDKHRAHLLVDLGVVLKRLRSRTHSAMPWDERYAPFIRRAGLLPLARTVNAGLPRIDAPALTALVDRWRPETHTFHLPCGELTVTLQDVAMILGLPINGHAVTGMVQPVGWRDMVEAALGLRPPEPDDDVKDRRTTGVSSKWLTDNFSRLEDPEADDAIVERYARAWLWHLLGGFLFPDGSGNTISWMVFPIIAQTWETMATYSWGSAVLAYLYRQLCDACRRSGEGSSLGGCLYLLQIWMWEHFPIARPSRAPAEEWAFEDEGSLPTVAFLWKNAINVVGVAQRRYMSYTNEFDVLTDVQVTWHPYDRDEINEMNLSPICTRDAEFWRIEIPLIFYYAVEWHIPQRVMRQFDRLQQTNVACPLTNKTLHKFDRRKQRGAVNWAEKHQPYVAMWDNRGDNTIWPTSGPAHRARAFKQYLEWLHANSRLHLRPGITEAHIADLPDSDDEDDLLDEYDVSTRDGTQPERAPLHNYTATQLARLANEAGHVLRHPEGSVEELGALRSFAQRIRRSCRRLALKFNCIQREDILQQGVENTNLSQTPSRSAGRTASSSRTRNVCSTSRGIAASSSSEEAEYEVEGLVEHSSDDQVTIGPSQLHDAPEASQQSQRRRRQPRRRKEVDSANALPTNPGRARKKKKPYTPAG